MFMKFFILAIICSIFISNMYKQNACNDHRYFICYLNFNNTNLKLVPSTYILRFDTGKCKENLFNDASFTFLYISFPSIIYNYPFICVT